MEKLSARYDNSFRCHAVCPAPQARRDAYRSLLSQHHRTRPVCADEKY
jgi:hypothetical protein